MELDKLILTLLSGGATGYITNNYAVKMLFKRYGPFGGMILATRGQFIKSVSELVERDIINRETIAGELEKYEFRKVFYNLVADILQKQLYNNTPPIKTAEIPKFEQASENLVEFCETNSEFISQIARVFLEHIKLEELFGKQQQLVVATKLQDILLQELKSGQWLVAVSQGCYQEYKTKVLQEFIVPEIFTSVTLGFEQLTKDFHENLPKEFIVELEKFSAQIYSQSEWEELLKKLESSLRAKNLQEILGIERTESTIIKLSQQLQEFWQTPLASQITELLASEIIATLQTIDISLLKLLDAGLNKNLEKYLQEQLPAVLESVICWAQANKIEIETLINQATDEVLEADSSGFFDLRGKIKKMLKANFADNLAKEYGIVNYFLNYIQQDTDVKFLSRQLSQKLVTYIAKNSISKIVQDLQAQGVLQSAQLAVILKNNLKNYLFKVDSKLFLKIFQTQLGEFFPEVVDQKLAKQLREFLMKQLQKQYLCTPQVTKDLQQEVRREIKKWPEKPLSECLSPERCALLAEFMQNKFIKNLESSKTELIVGLNKLLAQEIADKNVLDSCTAKTIEQLCQSLKSKVLVELELELEKIQAQPVSAWYDKLNNHKDSIKNITSYTLKISNKNLQVLLAGKIKAAVAANLTELPDCEIQEIVENFMGKELKPINFFGAILGGAAGLGTLYLENMFVGRIPLAFSWVYVGLVYGFVGYITNVIALKMIFKPYQEKKIWGLTLPFTPGVVSKQKPRFAKSMANFVGENLLTPDSVKTLFQAKKELVAENFFHTISADNYKVLERLINSNSAVIASAIWQLSKQHIAINKSLLGQEMVQLLSEINLHKFQELGLEKEFEQRILGYLENSGAELSKLLQQNLRSPNTLAVLLPKTWRLQVEKKVGEILATKMAHWCQVITDEQQTEKLVLNYRAEFREFSSEKLQNHLSIAQIEQLKFNLHAYFWDKIQEPQLQSSLQHWLDSKLRQEVAGDKKIALLFDGLLLKLLQENGKEIFSNILVLVQQKIQKQHGEIKDAAYKNFRQTAGVWLRGADLLFDIESSIYGVIDNLLEQKMPCFMQKKEQELQAKWQDFIENTVAETRVCDLGLELDIGAIMDLLEGILKNPQTKETSKKIVELLTAEVLKTPLHQLLQVADLDDILQLYRLFAKETIELRQQLVAQLVAKNHLIEQGTLLLSQVLLQKTIWQMPLNKLAVAIDPVELEQTVNLLLNYVLTSKVFPEQLTVCSGQIATTLYKQKLANFIDSNLAQADFEKLLTKILENPQISSKLQELCTNLIEQFSQQVNQVVSQETKDFILEIALQSLLAAIEEHLLKIITAVNIQAVTERQINDMEPEAIEEMFNSFAQPYFSKIATYGWLGGGMGILAKVLEKIITQIK